MLVNGYTVRCVCTDSLRYEWNANFGFNFYDIFMKKLRFLPKLNLSYAE